MPKSRRLPGYPVDIDADELLGAVASLCMSTHNDGPGRERMVAQLVDGLRYGARGSLSVAPAPSP